MPTPISNTNSSVYDPNTQFSAAEGCDAAAATCAASSPGPLEVTIPPVVITGDAGARQLVKQLDQARGEPNCSHEALDAMRSCGKMGMAAVGGIATAPTGIGAVLGIGVAFAESLSCGEDLRFYYDCENP